MAGKPQGFPFRFFGREPVGAEPLLLDYAVSLVEPIVLASSTPAQLQEAFAGAIAKEAADAVCELRFDPANPLVVRASITTPRAVPRADASKLVVRGLYAVHALAPVAECVHLPSRGVGESTWDRRTREVQVEPSPQLLACAAGVRAGDAALAQAAAAPRVEVKPPLSLVVLRGKTLPLEDVTSGFTGDTLAEARQMGSLVRADRERARVLWHHAGVIAEQALLGVAHVVADLGNRPLRATHDSARIVPLDASCAVVAVRRSLQLLRREAGLLRPVSTRPLPRGSAVTLDATSTGLVIVGIACEEPARASIAVLAVENDRLVPRAEVAVDAELWGRSASIAQLEIERRAERVFITASFANGGRMLRTVGLAELIGLESLVPSSGASTESSSVHSDGASLARTLPDGSQLVLIPTLEVDSKNAVPAQRRVEHRALDGTRSAVAIPAGGYTALDTSPSGAVALVAQGLGHGTTRFFDVKTGTVLVERPESPRCGCFLDEERAMLGSELVSWRDGRVLGRAAVADSVLAVRDPSGDRIVVLTLDDAVFACAITDSGLGDWARLAGHAADLRATPDGVFARIDGAWRRV